MSDSHGRSALIALLLAIVLIGGGQVSKATLSASRGGTLVAGGLGALVFLLLLTAISNGEMAAFGDGFRAGIAEVVVSLFVALVTSATIHRVAGTLCVLFSLALLYFVSELSAARYGSTAPVAPIPVQGGKKKK